MKEKLKVNVILLRLNPEDLSEEQREQFEKVLFDCDIEYVRTDPKTYIEHAADCRKLKPVAVLLPGERPIPSLAMEEGFVHVAWTPAGLQQLEPLKPKFSEFILPSVYLLDEI